MHTKIHIKVNSQMDFLEVKMCWKQVMETFDVTVMWKFFHINYGMFGPFGH